MRLNKFIAACTPLSRRAADAAIAEGKVTINSQLASNGSQVKSTDVICLNGVKLTLPEAHTTIMLNKPVGYVCSRNGQGSRTVFELLPPALQHLQSVGRLDKDSSGLLLLTDDGELANKLTHPRYAKIKVYEVTLDKPLAPLDQQIITDTGITLEDGKSQFLVTKIDSRAHSASGERSEPGEEQGRHEQSDVSPEEGQAPPQSMIGLGDIYQITMQEGRNRQIRRTFAALGYTVTTLQRTHFGAYTLNHLAPKHWMLLS